MSRKTPWPCCEAVGRALLAGADAQVQMLEGNAMRVKKISAHITEPTENDWEWRKSVYVESILSGKLVRTSFALLVVYAVFVVGVSNGLAG